MTDTKCLTPHHSTHNEPMKTPPAHHGSHDAPMKPRPERGGRDRAGY